MGAYIRSSNYPSHLAASSPCVSGAGARDASYTGSSVATLDCTALLGRHVSISIYVAADGADAAGAYRFAWITEDEADGSPGFVSGDLAATLTPAEGSKIGRLIRPGELVSQVVDAGRPILMYQPLASVSSAESIDVVVDEPLATT